MSKEKSNSNNSGRDSNASKVRNHERFGENKANQDRIQKAAEVQPRPVTKPTRGKK